MTRMLDPLSLSLSADEALALRHLFVWLEGLEDEGRTITPDAYAAEFSPAERDILAGLRRLFVRYEFPGAI